jgi:peptide/nickel transport system ATP-binding protein
MQKQATGRLAGELILDVKDMRIQVFGDRGEGPVLVHDVSFTLKRGEVIGLIGESGAGKSTIGLACLGYTRSGARIVGGTLLFGGRDIRQMTAAERRALRGPGVAYIAQSAAASFNPSMTLMQQVTEVTLRRGLMSRAEARSRAIALFRELELPDPDHIGDRYPHQVSGGQLQRAMAAMAMVSQPDIVVFDEPTTALDVTTQVEVLASFKKLIRENGTAAIYITHDLAVVAQIADDIMVLRHGRMVEYGTAVQILKSPQQEYTRRLVSERVSGHGFLAEKDVGERPVLDVENVVASYSGLVKVIDGVSLNVYRGDTVAVVGESGSGKSTLARVIIGLLPRQSGEIRFEGTSLPPRLGDRTRDQLRRIQMIYQMADVALNPNQTLGEIIGRPVQFYFGRGRREVRARVLELLDMMGLPQTFINRRPAELSGGQKQRVGIARALAAEPDLIICDEVTSALDQLVGEEILRLLKKLQEDLGVAYLFITHDLGTVKRIANKVAVMLKGQLVAGGNTATVFAPPYHPYTQLLLSSVPEMRPDWLEEIRGQRAHAVAALKAARVETPMLTADR